MDRATLDDKENRDSRRQALVDAFNDYDTYNYTNRTFIVVNNNNRVAAPNMALPFQKCGDLNPSIHHGVQNYWIRDHVWLYEQVKKLRSKYSAILANYHRSGEHDAEDEYAEFNKFVAGDGVMLYFFVVLGGDSITSQNFLAKVLPDDITYESGVCEHLSSRKKPVKRNLSKGDGSTPAKKIVQLDVRLPQPENAVVAPEDQQLLDFSNISYGDYLEYLHGQAEGRLQGHHHQVRYRETLDSEVIVVIRRQDSK